MQFTLTMEVSDAALRPGVPIGHALRSVAAVIETQTPPTSGNLLDSLLGSEIVSWQIGEPEEPPPPPPVEPDPEPETRTRTRR